MSRVTQVLLTRELRAIYSKYTNEISTPNLLASLKYDLIEFAAALRLEGALDPTRFRELSEHIRVEMSGGTLCVQLSPQLQAALLGDAERPSPASPSTPQARLPEPPRLAETSKSSIGKRVVNMQKEELSDT